MITLKKIINKKEMKQFVTFPFSLYKNNNYWVPHIIKYEFDNFDPLYSVEKRGLTPGHEDNWK